IVCEKFITCNGIQVYQRILEIFATDTITITKIVGLFSNIAEVEHLRIYLRTPLIIEQIEYFLLNSAIDIAYFSAGILSHLLLDEHDNRDDSVDNDHYKLISDEMRRIITLWRNPDTSMVTYRSFKPFLPLLKCQISAVQLWAVWAIYHVCSTDGARYRTIIPEEKVIETMFALLESHSNKDDLFFVQLINDTLHVLYQNCI
ncbi:unnamed protein product, partial [Didymodactylos carnosus]